MVLGDESSDDDDEVATGNQGATSDVDGPSAEPSAKGML